MKTAKELLEVVNTRKDWKHLKLWTWADDYEEKYNEWNNLFPPVSDDRRVYINTYKMVYDAIDSLQDNPPSFVCVAINNELKNECRTMNKILAVFQGR